MSETVNAVKPIVYPCLITSDIDSLTVFVHKTKNTYKIDTDLLPMQWDTFDQTEKAFLDSLGEGEVSLTAPQVREFLRLYGVANEASKHAADDSPTVASSKAETDYAMKKEDDVKDQVEEAKRIIQLAKDAERRANDKRPLYHVSYYVPTLVTNPPKDSGRKPMFNDLALRMRKKGLSDFDGSNWTCQDDNKPTDIEKEFKEWNDRPEIAATANLPPKQQLLVDIVIVEWSERSLQEIRNRIYNKLRQHICTLTYALNDNLQNAVEKLDTAIAEIATQQELASEEAKANKRNALRAKAISGLSTTVSNARRDLRNAMYAASLFDETECVKDLETAMLNSIRTARSALQVQRETLRVEKWKASKAI